MQSERRPPARARFPGAPPPAPKKKKKPTERAPVCFPLKRRQVMVHCGASVSDRGGEDWEGRCHVQLESASRSSRGGSGVARARTWRRLQVPSSCPSYLHQWTSQLAHVKPPRREVP